MSKVTDESIPGRSSIHESLAKQASIHLAADRLSAKAKGNDHEFVWVADHLLQQHSAKPATRSELYDNQIPGRSFLIGLLTASLHKTTPGGAWWKASRHEDGVKDMVHVPARLQRYTLPEVGDEVLVAFEHGDIRRPYVIGSLWNPDSSSSTKPPESSGAPAPRKRASKHAS